MRCYGTAVTSAILKSKFDPYPKKIIACTIPSQEQSLKETFADQPLVHVSAGVENNNKAVTEADVIILGCKPYMYEGIYEEVKESLTGKQLLISLLAGTTIKELSIFTPYVAKVMTNTPARFGCGTAAIAFAPEVSEESQELVMKLIDTVGMTVKIPEKNMDIATSLIGSDQLLFIDDGVHD